MTSSISVSPIPAATIDVYAKDVGVGGNGTPVLGYRINGGGFNNIGFISSNSCDFITTISGFSSGDTIRFETTQLYVLGGTGSGSSCPGTSGGVTYDLVATGAGQAASITINRDNIP